MRFPSFDGLAEDEDEERRTWPVSGPMVINCGASNMHPNTKLYKYRWWVFHRDSPCDGSEFLSKENQLGTKEAMDLIQSLQADGRSCWIYNSRSRRYDPNNTPWDWERLKDEIPNCAPPWDDDPDEEWNGHK